MRDSLVRKSFHKSILKSAHVDVDTIVIDELGLRNGLVRADIAVLNGKMIGYEIKTDNDNLSRLEHQIKAYNEVFDRVYIITGSRHFEQIIKRVPDWWGIYLIQSLTEEEYKFKLLRKPKVNRQKSSIGIAHLLWKDELIEVLSSTFCYYPKTSTTKQELYRVLQEFCSANKLTKIALKHLKCREGWRIDRKVLL